MRKLMMIGAAMMVGVVSVAGAQIKTVREEARAKPGTELRTSVGVLDHDLVLRSTRSVDAVLHGSFEPAPYAD